MSVVSRNQKHEYWHAVAMEQKKLFEACKQTAGIQMLYLGKLPKVQNTRCAFLYAVERGHACGFLRVVNRDGEEWPQEEESRLSWKEPYEFVVKDAGTFLTEFAVFFDTQHDDSEKGKKLHGKAVCQRWANIIGFRMKKTDASALIVPKKHWVKENVIFCRDFEGISPNAMQNELSRKKRSAKRPAIDMLVSAAAKLQRQVSLPKPFFPIERRCSPSTFDESLCLPALIEAKVEDEEEKEEWKIDDSADDDEQQEPWPPTAVTPKLPGFQEILSSCSPSSQK